MDWSGTTIDYGCIAPAIVFVDLFQKWGVEITMAEARIPMGTYKRDHIAQVLQLPTVAERWSATYGRPCTDNDVQTLFEAFVPLQIAVIARYTDLIPGVKDTLDICRARGLKIGSCTGYTREMMAEVMPAVKTQGYEPDALVCPEEVAAGRPAPWMAIQNAMRLGIYPMEALVKIGDTVVDIEEGLNAGMWTIGLAKTGNEPGLTLEEMNALAPAEQARLITPVREKLFRAGAHYVVDGLADILPVLDDINRRLGQGERP